MRRQVVFGSLFLSSGAALVVYALSGVSLLASLLLALVVVTITGGVIWRRAAHSERTTLRASVQAGLVAGALATCAYDLFRFLLVKVAGFTFWPFDIFSIFGQALVGAQYSGPWVTTAGVAYHIVNGVGFGVAYSVWLGKRGVLAGILWAFVLELMMVSIYPGWLGLKALNEFLQVSVFGHFVYGSTLGYTARILLERKERVCRGTAGMD